MVYTDPSSVDETGPVDLQSPTSDVSAEGDLAAAFFDVDNTLVALVLPGGAPAAAAS